MNFLLLLILPFLIALGFFIFDFKKITWQEFLIHIGAQIAIAGVSILIIYHMDVSDTELWNGTVSYKEHHHVGCIHSYSCDPYPCSCGKYGCSTCWHTCYEHPWDMAWNVHSNIGEWSIDNIDPQGLREPPRWSQVQIGEPVVMAHSFDNYIKGASNTLFRYSGQEKSYLKQLPPYNQNVYDYYKVNRIFTVQYPLSDPNQWNLRLAQINGVVGYQRQCNIILLFTSLPDDYFYALTQHWLGGKKNDIVIVIGAKDNKITWTNVMCWSQDEIYQVKIIDDLKSISTIDQDKIMSTIAQDTMRYYKRKHMKDFEYLKASIQPTATQFITAMVIGIIASIVIGVIFINIGDQL